MADKNQNQDRPFNPANQDWDQNRNRTQQDSGSNRYRNEYGHGNFGNNQGRDFGAGYENSGFGGDWNSGRDQGGFGGNQDPRQRSEFNRTSFNQDNDQNRNFGSQQYGNSSLGSSGSFGQGEGYGQDFNPGGYNRGQDRGSFGQQAGYGGSQGGQDWNRNQAWGRNQGQSGHSGNYGQGEQWRQEGNRSFGQTGGQHNAGNQQYRGHENRNYGQSHQGNDRGWWERTRDEVSSWFGDDSAERRRDQDQRYTGAHRGKGPKDYRRSEDRIREDICDRLTDDDRIDASHIQVRVQGDEVVLMGTVSDRNEKRRAEDIVESISGVRHVENRIRVGRGDERTGQLNDQYVGQNYTGTTDDISGIGESSGTTVEVIRDVNNPENKNK